MWEGKVNPLYPRKFLFNRILHIVSDSMHLEAIQSLEGHDGRVWHCAWNPKGTLLATCGEDTNIRLWGKEIGSTGDKKEKWVCQTILTEAHSRTVRSVAWSACGKYIASASFDGTVAVWDKNSGQFECTATLEGRPWGYSANSNITIYSPPNGIKVTQALFRW